jgi:sugar/nucleoside kinase (ribokinase family)
LYDLVTIGHLVRDLIYSPTINNPKITIGGPAAFVSLTANKLGANASIISKVGMDFQEHLSWFRRKKIDLSNVRIIGNARTTHFVLRYNNGERTLQLKSKAPQIGPKDIPASLSSRVIHVAPVANEVPIEIIPKIRKRAQLLSIDPQGFLRRFDKNGFSKLERPNNLRFLQQFDIFKSTIQEIRIITGSYKLSASIRRMRKYGVKIILITMGGQGALVCFDERFYNIPAYKPKIVKDQTGAGDAFIGAFLAEYLQGKEPLWCCCVGSAAASLAIEEVGSQHLGEENDMLIRATEIYEKGIKPLPIESIT